MRVAVGSHNPVKINAATRAFTHYWPQARVEGVEVPSGVHHTPLDDAVEQGATNRAKGALQKAGADFGVGMEGGLFTHRDRTLIGSCVAVTDGSRTHVGYSAAFELPDSIVKQVKNGRELDDVLVAQGAATDNRHTDGAFGLFTDNAVSRSDAFYQAVIGALVPFRKAERYTTKP